MCHYFFRLKEIVDKINEFLEELKYESEELYGEEEDENLVERWHHWYVVNSLTFNLCLREKKAVYDRSMF